MQIIIEQASERAGEKQNEETALVPIDCKFIITMETPLIFLVICLFLDGNYDLYITFLSYSHISLHDGCIEMAHYPCKGCTSFT